MKMQKSLSDMWQTPAAMSVQEVKEESWLDPEVSQLRECITTGEWDNAPPQYKAVRSELCILGKVVLIGTRLLIPTKLRDRVCRSGTQRTSGVDKDKTETPQQSLVGWN